MWERWIARRGDLSEDRIENVSMTQAINISLIILFLGFATWKYAHDYHQGLIATIFLLLLLPDSLQIQVSLSLPSFTIHRLLLVVTAVAWALNKKVRKDGFRIPFFTIQVIIAAAYLVSTALSHDFLVSAKRYLYFISESFLFFWIVQTSITNRAIANRIFRAAAFSLLVVAAISYVERYGGIHVRQILPATRVGYDFEPVFYSSSGKWEETSTYNHRILFGVACAVCVPCFLITMSSARRRKNRYHWLACLISAGALYFSKSRGPWISFAGGLAVLTMLFPRRFIKTATFLSAAALLVMIVRPGVYESLLGMSNATLDKSTIKGSSFRWRLTVFNMARTRIAEADLTHTLFGFGGGSHVFMEFGRVELSTGRSVQMESWDSELSVNLFEQGVVGFAMILLLYASFAVRTTLRAKRQHPPDDALVFAIACIAIIFLSKVTVRFFSPQLIYLEGIGLAISSSYLQHLPSWTLAERTKAWKQKETSALTSSKASA